ncbi:MAG: hypothetical protein ACJAVL_001763 [Bacteroidia bacterium]|jgi:hypothetical protein
MEDDFASAKIIITIPHFVTKKTPSTFGFAQGRLPLTPTLKGGIRNLHSLVQRKGNL